MNKIIVQSTRLHCPVERAFAMFTQNAHLEAWLATTARVEPEVGGSYELFWDPENLDINGTRGCKVTAFEQNILIAFEWKGPAMFRFMNEVDPLTHVSVFFTPCSEVLTPCTDVYLVHTGWQSTADWEEARQFFVRSWESALSELETLINS